MTPQNVLIVDDDDLQRRVLAVDLEAAGFDVSEAGSAADALRMAKAIRPAVIVLDVMMPGESGFDCLRQLKEDPKLWDVPVVMLTAADTIDDELEGMAGGVDQYLTKPAHPDLVLQTVRKLLPSGQPRG